MKHLHSIIIAILIALIISLIFTANYQSNTMRYQLYRIDQLEKEVRQGRAEVDRLLEELAGIKIEKVPDDLLIH